MNQKDQKDAVSIGPNPLVRGMTIVFVPLLLFFFLYPHESNFPLRLWYHFMLVIFELGAFISGGFSVMICQSGITQFFYGITLRTIPWDNVLDILCYPRKKSGGKKVTVKILVRLEGCEPKLPTLSAPEDYFIFHMRKSLFISHGNYAPAFTRFISNITYIYPRA